MTRPTVALIVALVLVSTAATVAATDWIFARTAVVAGHALWNQDGTPSDRFQVGYISDRNNLDTCVMVLRDALTGQFSTTAVHPGSCRP